MDKQLLAAGASKFNVDISTLQVIGGFSNNVFESSRNGEKVIIKFYPSSRYNKDSIIAEIDWVSYLSSAGANVTAPLPSGNGQLIEVIRLNSEEYYVLAFEKASGTFINTSDTETWNENFFYKLGITLGSIHYLSKKYKPSNGNVKRQEWNMGLLFSKPLDHISKGVVAKWDGFIRELHHLPKDTDGYGMTHNDLHQNNYYVDKNEVILFDFGDCEYNWFVYDIAIVLYHAVQSIHGNDPEGRKEFAILFIKSFLKGYLEENKLESYWIKKLPFFLNYRQIYSYIYFETFLDEDQKTNEKIKKILYSMRKRIENDIPYLDLSYEDLT